MKIHGHLRGQMDCTAREVSPDIFGGWCKWILSKFCCGLGLISKELIIILIVKTGVEVTQPILYVSCLSPFVQKAPSPVIPLKVLRSSSLALSPPSLSRVPLTPCEWKTSRLTTHTASFSLNTYTCWPLVRGRAWIGKNRDAFQKDIS